METSTMKYPFGRCSCCGKEFNSELRDEYQIEHCPWCGEGIDDFISPSAQVHPDDIYCDECGCRIYERHGVSGRWLTVDGEEKQPGQCSGPCERELCGNCGDWDDEGCCPKCHEEKPQQCAQCGVMTDNIVNEEHCCPDCEKELLEQGEEANRGIKRVYATGWWKVSFDINLQFEGEHERFGDFRFEDLCEVTQEHILNCIRDGFTQGQIVEDYDTEVEEDEKRRNEP